MRGGRGAAAVVASPVLVGAVTTLIAVVSVFLAYQANKGLPFVPTYDLSARLPNGSNLVPGNEVRLAGFRVGVVDTIKPATQTIKGRATPIAQVNMKLDKTVEPLAVDTRVIVRARSALGLKFVELTPGRSKQTFKPGGTIPLVNARLPVEFDDFLNTFDDRTRVNSRLALTGYGDAFAGRGADLNTAIEGLNPFFRFLTPVMRNLNDPRTGLKDFFKNIGETSAQVAPVARVQAELFTKMADTFDAFNRCPGCLQATIEKNPPTLDTAIRSFRVQQPFLVDFTDLSRRLIPAANALPVELPKVNSALAAGTRVLPQTVTLNRNTERVFRALDDLVQEPSTGLALADLRDTLGVTKPLINYVAPFQTVCNDTTAWITALGQHQSEGVSNGTAERVLLKDDNRTQDNRYGNVFNDRPVDLPKGVDPTTATSPTGALQVFHDSTYFAAIDAQGNADCESGQTGYIDGPVGRGRYPAHGPVAGDDPYYNQFNRRFAGGTHASVIPSIPGLQGTTFTGVPNLRDVP
ncbi:MAG: phospholipid/cholesterol/gamma-HCH transport system substrate-binding protein [Thermoleophilaceae bacterium]|nr:phospholipid/cholesterol/gamma-HCH transport system substrate-binding protein [Thermoleophilaceae bacterium]